jgi:hypothetical protein
VTASRASAALFAALLTAAAGLSACRSPAGAPPASAFRPSARVLVPPPDVADRTAVEAARAALISDRAATERALWRMNRIETVLTLSDDKSTGLVPVSIDLLNATLDDRRAYRGATQQLLARNDLDPALRVQLEQFRDDDPLELANDRVRDALLLEFGRAFNSLAEPIGRSIMTWQLAPYRLGRSLVNYAVQIYTRDALILQRRQALVHWKEFLERNPDAPEAEEIEPRVRAADGRYRLTQRNQALKVAQRALDLGKVRLALVYADRALRLMPEDHRASELRAEAAARLLVIRDDQRRSLEASPRDPVRELPRESRALALALLEPGGDLAQAAQHLREADPHGLLADEARFAEAIALGEAGDVEAMWDALEELADDDDDASNMARHAAALLGNPDINAYAVFQEARSRDRWNRVKWVFFGPFFAGVPDRGLPGPIEWIVDAPSVAESIAATPMRLINVPWAKALPSARLAAAFARRALEREPEGPRAEEVRDWLQAYESKRGNWIGALAAAEKRPDADLADLAELREQAAAQYLQATTRQRSLSMRLGMYRQLANIYPGSRAARLAGTLARTEAEEATLQRVRVSKEYLVENPSVAGPRGLGLLPELLDGDPANAELHPEGVTLVGGRVVRVNYLAASGDEDDAPERRLEKLDEAHLARVVSQLEETSFRNMLLDPLNDLGVDAQRDLFFERVRLGLAEQVDTRSDAISNYAYRGLRERYGMVRARESILPFDIVVQGSLSTLSLGAFPRIRPPRETPDAFLYR